MGNICFLNKKRLTKDFTGAMVNYTSNEPHNKQKTRGQISAFEKLSATE